MQLVNGPGFDFVGDKQFCMYVDRLVRFYLREEPLLCSIPTLSFAENTSALLAAVFDQPDVQSAVVLKRVDGRGGDSVWVGPMLGPAEFKAVRPLIEREPAAFLVQKYIALSPVGSILLLAGVTPPVSTG